MKNNNKMVVYVVLALIMIVGITSLGTSMSLNNKVDNTKLKESSSLIKYVEGDGTNVGDLVCIDTECFYVLSNDGKEMAMLAKYNLFVGNKYDGKGMLILEEENGIQNEKAKGLVNDSDEAVGVVSAKNLMNYLNDYKKFLSELGVNLNDVRLVSDSELSIMGYNSDDSSKAYEWATSTSYWTMNDIVLSKGVGVSYDYIDAYLDVDYVFGVRPVVVIDIS